MLNNKAMPAGRQAFTLLESILAIFIVTMGTGGIFVLVNQNILSANSAKSKLVAAYLAQEGMEITRNIRDSNFLKIRKGVDGISWDTGITSSDWQPVVFIDGTPSNFQRKITILENGDILNVSTQVSWKERGISHQFIIKENLHKL